MKSEQALLQVLTLPLSDAVVFRRPRHRCPVLIVLGRPEFNCRESVTSWANVSSFWASTLSALSKHTVNCTDIEMLRLRTCATEVCVYYCSTNYKAVRVVVGGKAGTCATRDDEPRPVWTSLPIMQ